MLSQRGMAGVGKPSTRWSERGVTGGRRVSLTAEPGFYGHRQPNFGGTDAINLRLESFATRHDRRTISGVKVASLLRILPSPGPAGPGLFCNRPVAFTVLWLSRALLLDLAKAISLQPPS
jgi:hypothetical protein